MRRTLLTLGILGITAVARAQSVDPTPETTPPIELDGSIGPGGEVGRIGNTWQIVEGLGEYRGRNLFHSFGRFHVPGGQIAEFSAENGNPNTHQLPDSVWVRVLWERSDIDGTLLSSIPGADLYLINPEGVRFGGGAQIQVDGSFHASSAGRVEFDQGQHVFVTNAAVPLPLLDFGDPSVYGFLPSGGGPIEINQLEQGALSVKKDATFAAIGGSVRIRGNNRPTFVSPGSRIVLIAAGPDVSVPLPDPADFDPSTVDPAIPLGDVDISLQSSLFVSDPASGSVVVRGGNFTLGERSFIFALHNDAADSSYTEAVDIAVRDQLRIAGDSQIQAGTVAAGRGGGVLLSGGTVEIVDSEVLVATAMSGEPGSGAGSDLTVSGGALNLSEDGKLTLQTLGTSDAGDLAVRVRALSLAGASRIANEATDAGAGGDIRIEAEQISLLDGSEIFAGTSGTGDSGNVTLLPRAGGGLEIHASNNSLIGTTTTGLGTAGSVLITGSENGHDSITLEGGPAGPTRITALAFSKTSDPTVGNAGNIHVETDQLSLLGGGHITASTNGSGNAGKVTVFADTIDMRGRDADDNASGLFAQSIGEILDGAGLAGGILVDATGDVSLADGARIFVETRTNQPAGDITIQTDGRLSLDAATISARSELVDSPARSGSIHIDAARGVFVSNGSVIGSRSTSEGRAGEIVIHAGPEIELSDSELTTSSTSRRDAGGGTIELVASDRIVLTDSTISTSVQKGGGNGGSVSIDPDLLLLNRSEIRADAIDGDGGIVVIRAGTFVRSGGSEVTADAFGEGDPGLVVIESPEADLASERAQPAQEFLDAAALMRTACGAGASQSSSFVVERVAGLPASPEGPLPAPLWEALGASVADAGSGGPAVALGSAPRLPATALAGGCAAREGSG